MTPAQAHEWLGWTGCLFLICTPFLFPSPNATTAGNAAGTFWKVISACPEFVPG
jgi:hypothetical protein